MAQAGQGTAGAKSTPPAEQTTADPAAAVAERVKELEAENARLAAEVGQLRGQLVAAGTAVPTSKLTEPSFVFSEGQRDELERTGRTVSPFTGERFVGTGADDARPATAEEFAKAQPPAARLARKN